MRWPLLAALAFFLSGTAGAAPGDPPGIASFLTPGQLVEVAPGRKLNLVCMGSGERTVLLDAGGSDWSVIWALVLPELARFARACAYDRAGLGRSDPARGERAPVAIVEDLHALVRAAGLKRPLVLVGHSLGGFHVKLYAALYPQDVAGLVLVDPSEERTWERTRGAVVARFGLRLAARAELLDRAFIAGLVARYRACRADAEAAPLDPASLAYRRCSDPVRPQLGPSVAADRARLQILPAYQAAQASEIVNSVYGDAGPDPVYARLFRPGRFAALPLVVLSHGLYDPADPIDALGQWQWLALHRETARLSRTGRQRLVGKSSHQIPLDAPGAVVAAVREVLAAP